MNPTFASQRGQITGGVLDGPLAIDNATSPEAAQIEGLTSPVPGHEAGNMLAKSQTFQAHADADGIVLGARIPIVLTSRADLVRSRLASCAFAALYASGRRRLTSVTG